MRMHLKLATAAFAAVAVAAPALAQENAESPSALTAPFTLPELPYEAGALDPVIDEETMTLHREKHHQSYVDKLNQAVEAEASLEGMTLEEILAGVGSMPSAVRNNAGGHWNHSFFWPTMAPPEETGEASAELTAAIEEAFGSMEAMQEEFNTAGADQFGSGWAWLIVNEGGELEITSTPNQDNPLMDVAETQGTPILGNDVWEHAYYLKYNNRRPEYLEAWWDVVNWEVVSKRFAEASTAQ